MVFYIFDPSLEATPDFPNSLLFLNSLVWSDALFRVIDYELFIDKLNSNLLSSSDGAVFNRIPLYKINSKFDIDYYLSESELHRRNQSIFLISDPGFFLELYPVVSKLIISHYFVSINCYSDIFLLSDFILSLKADRSVFYLKMDSWFFYDFISMMNNKQYS